jgi:uncharacterized protein (TIGR02594 family)
MMRQAIAATALLLCFSSAALATEPQMENRFGPGRHFLSGQLTKPIKVAKKSRTVIVKAPKQTHERVGDYAGSLIQSVRNDIGTNPTGWKRLWCAYYLKTKLPAHIADKVDNRAISFANLRRVGKQVGAIAVLTRRGGYHVGVVEGFDASGNPIILSGNHNRRVGRGVYSAARVVAYVSPS